MPIHFATAFLVCAFFLDVVFLPVWILFMQENYQGFSNWLMIPHKDFKFVGWIPHQMGVLPSLRKK